LQTPNRAICDEGRAAKVSESKVIDPRAELSPGMRADPSTNTLADPRVEPRTAALGISPSNEHPADSLLARQTALRWISSRFVPAGVGILATLISVIGSWIPSYWSDEAASVMSAQRTWPQLFNMLGNIDIVHGTYYVLLHFWIQLAGTTEFAVRFPSAVIVGVAAAGLVILGRQFGNAWLGFTAAIIFMVLPRTTYMGMEGRSYAFAAALAVWATIALIAAVRSGRIIHWVAYGALVAFGTYMFLYSILLVGAHLAYVLVKRPGRARVKQWIVTTGIAGVAILPIVAWGAAQHGQIGYLATQNDTSAQRIGIDQWFGTLPMAIVGWTLLAFAVGIMVRDFRLHRMGEPLARARLLGVAWALFPLALLLLVNLAIPVYTVRYMSFAAPGLALAIASVVSLLRVRQVIVFLTLWAVLATPSYIQERTLFAKGGADFKQIAEVISAHAKPGDAIIFDEATTPSKRTRIATRLYPAAFVGLRDVTLATPFWESSGIWDVPAPLNEVRGSLLQSDVVWDVRFNNDTAGRIDPDPALLQSLGYRVIATYPINRDTVYELSRSAP
jgi:mannosyltransferase